MALEMPSREAKSVLFRSSFELLPAGLAVEPVGRFGSPTAGKSKPSVVSKLVGTWNTLLLRTRSALLQSRRDAMHGVRPDQNSQSNYCGLKLSFGETAFDPGYRGEPLDVRGDARH